MPVERFVVLVSPLADEKLVSHITFLAKVSLPAADHLELEYQNALEYLAESPTSCPIYPFYAHFETNLRYKLFSNRYRLVFEIVENQVYIYDIQDCRQDLDKGLV